MPGLLSSIQRFDMSTGIPKAVWTALYANAARANLVLPHAEKVFGRQKFTPKIDATEQLWFVYSKPGTSEIQFILACTEGPLGKYPLYIIPTVPATDLTPELLKNSTEALCSALLSETGFRARVFSVFSVEKVTEAFVPVWERAAEIDCIKDPYYSAIFSVCTENTLVRQQRAPRPSGNVALEPRLATEQDAGQMSTLCYEFAKTSEPFTLTTEKASEEAKLLIANKQVWVLEMMKKPNGKPEIATIVAVTRKSEGVATITKVYTPEHWRGNGCAERLVRHVCIELLEKYKQIVLYVGVGNPAGDVYRRVGFQGLSEGSSSSERWLEIGFDPAGVKLGHW